mmetsp:Transcript_9527/g.19734  ORF Transcript_9527/g.19734 Transcript_9527/m.19734 type:complete len:96 (+) Transcript_9527:828-1115(+)
MACLPPCRVPARRGRLTDKRPPSPRQQDEVLPFDEGPLQHTGSHPGPNQSPKTSMAGVSWRGKVRNTATITPALTIWYHKLFGYFVVKYAVTLPS